MSATWKNAERQAAKALGGTRNQRGADFSQSLPDVEHSLFSVEVKYRKALPRLLRLRLEQAARYDQSKPPLLVVKQRFQRGALVVLNLSDFVALVGPLMDRIEQAADPSRKLTSSTNPGHRAAVRVVNG
ncbi:MAG TPA: hypothetical protein VGX03_23530 [Candidatus Binatia bacterium]|jgi:hypothetical protein|nr:hypothetical protein [Candidatus Binatia bacterium]